MSCGRFVRFHVGLTFEFFFFPGGGASNREVEQLQLADIALTNSTREFVFFYSQLLLSLILNPGPDTRIPYPMDTFFFFF